MGRRTPCATVVLGVVLGGLTATALAQPAAPDPAPAPVPAPEPAPTLADVRTAVEWSDYPAAKGKLDLVLRAGTASPRALAELYRLKGVVAAALGEQDVAVDAFQRCLAILPETELPPGTSPKIARPFAEARQALTSPIRFTVTPVTSPPSLSLVVTSDPLKMIARVRVTVSVDGGAEHAIVKPAADEMTIALPAQPDGGRLDLRVSVIDEHGNRIADHGSRELPIVIVVPRPEPVVVTPPPPPPPPRASGRPLVLRWWLWGGAAVASAGVATYFGMSARSAEDDLRALAAASPDHGYDEVKQLEDRGKRDALISNVGFAAAGTLAVVAVILFATDSREEPRRLTTTAVPVAGGGAIVLGGLF